MNAAVLNTTTHRYSIVVEASNREREATEAWRRAGEAYTADKSPANAVRLIAASITKDEATKNRKAVVGEQFPHQRKLEGSDTSMKASLKDAGFGEGGVF